MTAGVTALVLAGVWGAPLALVVEFQSVQPDAIVILASHEWERIPAAAELSRRHPGAAVVLTVAREVSDLSCHLCGQRPRWLNHLGVDGHRILEIETGPEGGTWGEALTVATEARRRGWTRLVVVTSPYHTRRTLWTFRRAAGDGVAVAVSSAGAFSSLRPARWWTTPEDRWYVAYESAALVSYAWRGRLAW